MKTAQIIRVAIIDDHDLLRKKLCLFLKGAGFETIFEADNGKIALEKLQKCKIRPDICIIDTYMPVMDGYKTSSAIKKKFPEIKLLVFSINDKEKDIVTMLQNGVDGYILKGSDPDELKRGIEVVCNGGRYYSMGIMEIVVEYFSIH